MAEMIHSFYWKNFSRKDELPLNLQNNLTQTGYIKLLNYEFF